jgi:hypothetical protein
VRAARSGSSRERSCAHCAGRTRGVSGGPFAEQEATASARPALGLKAFEYGRRSLTDLVSRGDDLGQILHDRYPREALAAQFHERLMNARQALAENRPELLGG